MPNLVIVPLNTDLPRRSLHRIASRIGDAFGGAYAQVEISNKVDIDPETHPNSQRFPSTTRGLAVRCGIFGIHGLLPRHISFAQRWSNDTLIITDMPLYEGIGGVSRTDIYDEGYRGITRGAVHIVQRAYETLKQG